jgi:alpha-beta hydrolase superfamily lysophospholipase
VHWLHTVRHDVPGHGNQRVPHSKDEADVERDAEQGMHTRQQNTDCNLYMFREELRKG